MTDKNDNINSVSGMISPVIFVLSFIADVLGILEDLKLIFQVMMLVAAIVMLANAIIFWRKRKYYADIIEKNSNLELELKQRDDDISQKDKEKKELEKKIEILEENRDLDHNKIDELELKVCDGKKYLSNKATINFNIKNQKYELFFEKRYIIISDAIKWFEGQFYSNKYLESADKSQGYYQDNPVQWDTLNIRAELKYKNVNDAKFSSTKELVVKQIAEGNNYKKFHIQYRTKKGNDKLPIKKGAEIILSYSYEVPVDLWGSYLNRYITYWKEYTEVTLKCKKKGLLNKENIKIYIADHNSGDPFVIDIDDVIEDTRNGEDLYIIKIPNVESGKYSVWWNANLIFDAKQEVNLNTNMTVDHSQQTQY